MLRLNLIVILLAVSVYCETILDFKSSDSVQWVVRNKNGSISVPAVVPGGIYSDLMRNGVIGDILSGFNDVNTRWVAHDVWTYTAKFNVTTEELTSQTANLVFQGLDTVAYVELNDNAVGKSDNMFVRYVFDVRKHLQAGVNTIIITFVSPVIAAKMRSDQYFVAPSCIPDDYHGECHANQIRKMQASFSWDWGPAFPSVGVWKPAFIEFYTGAIIRSITTHLTKNDQQWKIKLQVYLESQITSSDLIEGTLEAQLQLDRKNIKTFADYVSVRTNSDGTAVADLVMEINEDEVELWWPNGFGAQPLYDLRVIFSNQDNPSENSLRTIKIGFRTIEVVEEDASLHLGNNTAGDGLTFYFKVNGYPLFMKGSNWIPGHILPELGYNENIVDELLQAAQLTHMAMLRVWGGGVYESDYFYQRCDELGIMIWQDFMFACAMYPADDEFLSTVTKEVSQNVIRLQHHPSIAIWAGNNENEVALRGNWYDTLNEFDRYKQEYIKLYVDTIRPIVESIDPGRRYLISSPSNGIESEKEDYIAANPYSEKYGDTHYYNYISDGWSMNIYPQTRFASEYGFQAFPSLVTMRTATNDSVDFNLESEYSRHRQHSPGGNKVIDNLVQLHLNLENGEPEYFRKFVFYSQISQAMTIKAESEFYRQEQTEWYTMGALYWQLNDVWQAPSWSSIEYGGRWKMLHYYAKNFFNPILVSSRHLASGDILVYLINDKFEPLVNVTVTFHTFLWDCLTPVETKEFLIDKVQGLKAEKLPIIISALDVKHNESVFFKFTLTSMNGNELSPANYVFPEPLRSITGLKEPKIQFSVLKVSNNKYPYKNTLIVRITTDTPVLFLWLEADGIDGRFMDNGVILSEEVTKVEFVTDGKVNAKVLQAAITYQYYTG